MLAPMEAAFFDLDKTVIAKASLVAFGRPLYREGLVSRWIIVRALWSQVLFDVRGADEERMRRYRESALRVTRGWDQSRLSAIVRDTLTEVIDPIVYDEAIALIRQHQDEGRRVYLVSASPEEIVAPLARYLGVDDAIASRAELDDDGRYTGRVKFYSYGPYKAEAMRDAAAMYGIDLEASYAYSDSATDLPMLEAVGHPVAVNPDRELARVATERGWEIRQFRHGVPLRERVAMPPPRQTAIGAVAAALVVATSVGLWWLWRHRTRSAVPATRQQRDTAGRSTAAGAWDRVVTVGVRRPAASSPRTRRERRRPRGPRASS
jgi:HAD superfamily hydrolase (TIGR01490 family)